MDSSGGFWQIKKASRMREAFVIATGFDARQYITEIQLITMLLAFDSPKVSPKICIFFV